MQRLSTCFAVALVLGATGALAAQTFTRGESNEAAPSSRGQIVNFEPAQGVVVVRDAAGKEHRLKLAENVRYYGTDNKAVEGAQTSNQFRPGADVHYRTGPGNSISEMRLGTPASPGGRPSSNPAGNKGT